MNRRELLKSLAAATAAVTVPLHGRSAERDRWGDLLPKRKLGGTGETVTMLGVGGYHIGWTTERDAQEVIETAVAGGVRFFDTAESYGKGRSEERYAKYLVPKYRDEVFLMTKTQSTTAEQAREHLEGSLRRLNTDRIDLWQIHSLWNPEDVDRRLDNGVLEVLLQAREEGKVRHLGFTGHADPSSHRRMLERTGNDNPFAACQMPVNPVDVADDHSFVREVIPELSDQHIALLAMKTLADGRFFAAKNQHKWRSDNPVVPDRMSVQDALNFTWSLPVSVLITGAENAEFLREKIAFAREFRNLSPEDRTRLVESAAPLAEDGMVEYYKRV